MLLAALIRSVRGDVVKSAKLRGPGKYSPKQVSSHRKTVLNTLRDFREAKPY